MLARDSARLAPQARSGELISAKRVRIFFRPTGPRKSGRPEENLRIPRYLINSISEYFGKGHRSSATSFSSRSATSRTSSIATITVSRM